MRAPALRIWGEALRRALISLSSELTTMRMAWKVRVAGSIFWEEWGMALRTICASWRVEVMAWTCRALTMARATDLANRSSP